MVDSSVQIDYLRSAKECLNSTDWSLLLIPRTDVTSSAIDQLREAVKNYILEEKSLVAKIDQAIREIRSATVAVNKKIKDEKERRTQELLEGEFSSIN